MFTTILRKRFCYHILDGEPEVARRKGRNQDSNSKTILLHCCCEMLPPYHLLTFIQRAQNTNANENHLWSLRTLTKYSRPVNV